MLVDGPYPMPPLPKRGEKGVTVAYMIARTWVTDAMNGDKDARQELQNRLYGKIPDEVKLDDRRDMTPDEAYQRYMDLEAEKRRILGE